MVQELVEAQFYFDELSNKIREVSVLIKKVKSNPTNL
jgi:hypothetical protein